MKSNQISNGEKKMKSKEEKNLKEFKNTSLKPKDKKKKQSYLFYKLLFISFFVFCSAFIIFGKFRKINNYEIVFAPYSNESKYLKYEEEFKNSNSVCDRYDPINLFKLRIDNGPIPICSGKKSKHICYQNIHNYYNDIYSHKQGVICIMENIILNPSKYEQSGFSFINGPTDTSTKGMPILKKGFFNAECQARHISSFKYHKIYKTYFNSWNYNYEIKEDMLEELSPGKIIFFISRNQDSPNLFHGHSEVFNALAMLYLFNIDPKDVQIVFLESIKIHNNNEENENNKDIPKDPFYDIYKNMISRGGEPIYIRNLKKKYKISKAIHVPINWDSSLFLYIDFPKCDSPTKSYKLYNDFVDKYLDIKPFEDKFITDNETFYYPESILRSHETNNSFDKIVTIQWRKVWPKNRKGQSRILNNGPQLANKLTSVLPKNILVRLIDNAKLKMEDQIAMMRNTDYFIGLHGAGLSLSMFLPNNSIFHEIQHQKRTSVLSLMSALSGHKTYCEVIKSSVNNGDGNEMISFDEQDFVNHVLNRMKENNFF